MYDHVHLNKQGVKVFARVMKSTALGNAPGNSRNSNNNRSPHPTRSPHPPTRSPHPPTRSPHPPTRSLILQQSQSSRRTAITTQELRGGSSTTTKPCSCRTQPHKTSAEHRLLQTHDISHTPLHTCTYTCTHFTHKPIHEVF